MTERVRLGVEEIAGVADGSRLCYCRAVEPCCGSSHNLAHSRDGRVLVLVNGAYGHVSDGSDYMAANISLWRLMRIATRCRRIGSIFGSRRITHDCGPL